MLGSLILAVVAILLVLAIVQMARQKGGRKDTACGGGGGGPYNIQLYDSPRYYPYYWARDYTCPWDSTGRCAAYCGAGPPCTVSCR